ncbi:hypothetical protein Tco_1112053 [Tanacetum coccineum]|uniref:Uncharacterized protein n=1 Tax=Tanacetum coccineum TaxID=301880 RepID=A0ABQ5IPR8_9ASTR
MDPICEEVSHLQSRLGNMESSIIQIVSYEIKSSLPAMITNALKEQLPGILSAVSEQFAETQAQLNKKKELSKVIKSEVAKEVQVVELEGVYEDLQSQTKHISKYSSSFQDMQTHLRDVKDLLETAVIIVKTDEGEKKQKDTNTILAPTQGEQKTAENITPPKPSPEIQGELAYKESIVPVSETKVNEESAMVLYNPGKDLVDLTTTEKNSKDDDDLDKQPLSKRFKIMHLIPSNPQPSVKQFTDQLFGTTSSKYSPTPLREPTPPRDLSKGKAAAIIEEPGNKLGPLSQEEFDRQIKELKRISGLKAEKEKLEQQLRKLLNPATLKAQAQKWTEHEAKKAKMMEEYNHQISFRADIKAAGFQNLIPPPGIMPIQGLVINEPESGIFFMNGNTDIDMERVSGRLGGLATGCDGCVGKQGDWWFVRAGGLAGEEWRKGSGTGGQGSNGWGLASDHVLMDRGGGGWVSVGGGEREDELAWIGGGLDSCEGAMRLGVAALGGNGVGEGRGMTCGRAKMAGIGRRG